MDNLSHPQLEQLKLEQLKLEQLKLEQLKQGKLRGAKELKIAANLHEFPMEILELADSLELLVLSNNCLSRLPDSFSQLKKLKVVFFNNNAFETFPKVLAQCPALSMISFKGNRLKTVDEQVLSPAIRWLILTDNQLEALPADIGQLSKLQKLMLAGNRLTTLPVEMSACQNLELIRISANQLSEIPTWLFSLPRLSWLAYAGNPCCDSWAEELGHSNLRASAKAVPSEPLLLTILRGELQLGEVLGQGASGVIYEGRWNAAANGQNAAREGAANRPCESQVVAVKLFKGEMTSDGLPLDEMRACMLAGQHPNLVSVLGKICFSQEKDLKQAEDSGQAEDLSQAEKAQAGLVFSFIPPEYENLGGPPSLESCTRDVYGADVSFSLSVVLRIVRGIALALRHLHARGIMHGDLYAHNILIDGMGESILGDFGAASVYDAADGMLGEALERIEVRAFGCLLEDLLDRCAIAPADEPSVSQFEKLRQLQEACLDRDPARRSRFAEICEILGADEGS